MRTRLAAAFAVIALLASPSPRALADDGTPWRVTSPRVRLETAERRLELVIPAGRARGATSRAIPIEPGETYVALARLDLDWLVARGAFLRVALYARADGGGRQRARLDSTLLYGGGDGAVVLFRSPGWARAAKLRVLARPDRDGTELQATDPLLIRVQGVPVVVLRTDE
ncbi:MAG: hypothetical protein E6I87_04915 [Chloroflexi bacterium]|nr:MAG: hypothetical protein E6I87_04915 [Chloroflexota bacterium]